MEIFDKQTNIERNPKKATEIRVPKKRIDYLITNFIIINLQFADLKDDSSTVKDS